MFSTGATTTLINQVRCNLPRVRSAIASFRPLSISNDDDENNPANYTDIENKEPWWPPLPEPYVSVWERPTCCGQECDSYRHDVLFLQKTPRKYTRTWTECTPVKKIRKICSEGIMLPEYDIRPKRASSKVAVRAPCEGDQERLYLMRCIHPPKLTDPCYKIRLPGCKLPRLPPKCVVPRAVKCCQKRCTMYPSYSECKMRRPQVKSPGECLCLKVPSTCEVFSLFKKFPIK